MNTWDLLKNGVIVIVVGVEVKEVGQKELSEIDGKNREDDLVDTEEYLPYIVLHYEYEVTILYYLR